jgi:hypothetical protein
VRVARQRPQDREIARIHVELDLPAVFAAPLPLGIHEHPDRIPNTRPTRLREYLVELAVNHSPILGAVRRCYAVGPVPMSRSTRPSPSSVSPTPPGLRCGRARRSTRGPPTCAQTYGVEEN